MDKQEILMTADRLTTPGAYGQRVLPYQGAGGKHTPAYDRPDAYPLHPCSAGQRIKNSCGGTDSETPDESDYVGDGTYGEN